jgi:flagellar biosynthesis/type III secretory pathway M-ring protein FliF/YscJ
VPDFFKQVGAARFGVMAGVAAVLTAFFLYIAGAITEPPKTILFSGLESRDAAAVTGKLDSMAVKYDVKENGTIQSKSLEASTVDLAAEFTNLITTQRAYSASARIITTADQMLQMLEQLPSG